MNKHDPVNNPKHYDTFPGQQSIDLIQASLTPEEFAGFLKGNFLKYRFRAGEKDALKQDIDKSNWYRNKLFEVTKPERGNVNIIVSTPKHPEDNEVLKKAFSTGGVVDPNPIFPNGPDPKVYAAWEREASLRPKQEFAKGGFVHTKSNGLNTPLKTQPKEYRQPEPTRPKPEGPKNEDIRGPFHKVKNFFSFFTYDYWGHH